MDKSKAKVTEEEAHLFVEDVGQVFSHVLDKDYFLEVYQYDVRSRCET